MSRKPALLLVVNPIKNGSVLWLAPCARCINVVFKSPWLHNPADCCAIVSAGAMSVVGFDGRHSIGTALCCNMGVRVVKLVQNARDFIVSFPQAYHMGFSFGSDPPEAASEPFQAKRSAPLGPEAACRIVLLL